MRRRIIRPNTRSYTGRHVSPDGAALNRYESSLEHDLLVLLHFNRAIEIIEQPKTYLFADSLGQKRKYTPDFLVTLQSGVRVFYEVKFRAQLRCQWTTYRDVVMFMRHQARAEGATYRIVTEAVIRRPRLENARLLLPYLSCDADPAITAALKTALNGGPLTIAAAAQQLSATPAERRNFFACLWPMISQGQIGADLDAPLSMGSLIWEEVE